MQIAQSSLFVSFFRASELAKQIFFLKESIAICRFSLNSHKASLHYSSSLFPQHRLRLHSSLHLTPKALELSTSDHSTNFLPPPKQPQKVANHLLVRSHTWSPFWQRLVVAIRLHIRLSSHFIRCTIILTTKTL